MIDGIINVYKEKGYTSHDVVAKLRGILKQKKIGHTGTLDPDAVGVLPVCLGKATKLCDLLTDKDKIYEASMILGIVTDTQDLSGAVLEENTVTCTVEETENIIKSFVGEYDQIPPMYSAIKVNGKKLYEYARSGIEIERESRKVTIYDIEIISIDLPRILIKVHCSKGTYIRTLCHDIGRTIGCGASMESLVRTKTGQFHIEDSLKLSEIEQCVKDNTLQQFIQAIDSQFLQYPKITVQKNFQKIIDNGNPFSFMHIVSDAAFEDEFIQQPEKTVRVYDEDAVFVGIFEYRPDNKLFWPVKMFYGSKQD